jgi:hypothetical protein
MDTILQFEKTECPFKRTFTVVLPEKPQTPVKKRPWKPTWQPSPPTLTGMDESPTPSRKPSRSKLRLDLDDSASKLIQHDVVLEQEIDTPAATPQNLGEPGGARTNTEEESPAAEGSGAQEQLGPIEEPKPVEIVEPDKRWSMEPDQPSKDLAVEMTEEFKQETKMLNTTMLPPFVDPIQETQLDSELALEAVVSTDLVSSTKPSEIEPEAELGSTSDITSRLDAARDTQAITDHGEEGDNNEAAIHLNTDRDADTDAHTDIHIDEHKADKERATEVGIESEPVTLDSPVLYELHEGFGIMSTKHKKPSILRAPRSVTAPPQLSLITAEIDQAVNKDNESEKSSQEQVVSPAESSDSYHSMEEWHSPTTPPLPAMTTSQPTTPQTFPYPHDNIAIPKRLYHRRDLSDLTATPETRRHWDAESTATSDSSQESAATAPDTSSDFADQIAKPEPLQDGACTSTAVSNSRSYARHRATTSVSVAHRRPLSPLPPAANLFSPPGSRRQASSSRMALVRKIPMAIISKTCDVLFGPPSHLVSLMLKVAAKIVAGEWRGMVFGFGEGGEKIPVQWDYSDGEFSSWGDDDDYYYVAEHQNSRATSLSRDDTRRSGDEDNEAGASWEVD